MGQVAALGEASTTTSLSEQQPKHRLDSWKEIATHLKRDITTVQRWEKREDMPVHRHLHDKRGSVYAYSSELDTWLQSRRLRLEEEEQETEHQEAPVDAVSDHRSNQPGRVHRWPVLSSIAVLALVGIIYLISRSRAGDATRSKITSVAVLPLANLSGDPEQEYFADGITDALITELGRSSSQRVISRQSIMQYKGSKKRLSEIARELNVDAVLEGTVERSADQIRVIVRLDQVSPEGQLWSNQYNRDIRDLLRLQDEIARAVTDEIQVKLKPQERARLASSRPVNTEAQDDYFRALQFRNKWEASYTSEQDLVTAINYFRQAVEKDSNYALAYAGMADTYIDLGNPQGGTTLRKKLCRWPRQPQPGRWKLIPCSARLISPSRRHWNSTTGIGLKRSGSTNSLSS